MKKYPLILIVFLIHYLPILANQIDIGIFESASTPGKVEVKIRPDFNISSIETVTAILYAVRWDDPSVSLTIQNIYPFFLAPQGSPVAYNGHYYQVFASTPFGAIAMNANQEYLISSFTVSNGNCANFEIIEDEWTQSNNGNVYLEFLGSEVTGSIYSFLLPFGSYGGTVSGNDTIISGNSTGPMTLSGYNGNILNWQRSINGSTWTNIPGTAGIAVYNETPPASGNYSYRAQIQKDLCSVVFSSQLTIEVIDPPVIHLELKVFLEGCFANSEMNNQLNQLGQLPTDQPYNTYPWFYEGSEVLPSATDMVDWILIELRETPGGPESALPETRIARKAAMLFKNGDVKDISGAADLTFDVTLNQNLYVLIWHRNHLAVMSAMPLMLDNGVYSYDFTYGENQIYGDTNGKKKIASGIWGMVAGDGNGDGQVNISDIYGAWYPKAGEKGYMNTDFNLDGESGNNDKNDLWYFNNGAASQVPQ